MHAPPCVFRHCHRIALLCRLAHRKHLHLFPAKRDLSSHWRTPPHYLDTTLLRVSHLHNVASCHHSIRDPHHCTSHRLLCTPAGSRRSGLSRILGPRETLALEHCYNLFESLALGRYCSSCETLTLERCCRPCNTLVLGCRCSRNFHVSSINLC